MPSKPSTTARRQRLVALLETEGAVETPWGSLMLQSEHVRGEGRLWYPEWHSAARTAARQPGAANLPSWTGIAVSGGSRRQAASRIARWLLTILPEETTP